jgi:predicted kinase
VERINMSKVNVIVVTGLPGAGKTTLARELSARYGMPLIAKDLIKEPLLDVLGAADAAQSRKLSDASFAVLFGLARELVACGVSFILEGNFRPGEHEAPLSEALGLAGAAREPSHARVVELAQVLCQVPEDERLARLQARASEPTRHSGHRIGEHMAAPLPGGGYLHLPSKCLLHSGAGAHPVHASLDDWMNLGAASRRADE